MYFHQILNEEAGCSSYVLASRETKEALVVDPALDISQYLQLADHRDFRIVLVIDTHIHADHISGARKLAAATGADLAMYESADVLFPIRGLRDGEQIRLGQLIVEVLHTPGHRPEAISLLITNPERSPEPSMVLTGDSMFVGDVGRPDFGGEEGARQQYESVHRLLGLQDYVEVFPAHFEGSCGKGMCGRPSSTIGFERRFSPVLQLDEASFLRSAAEPPARPLNMNAIVATNRGEAEKFYAEPRSFNDLPEVPASEAPAWLASSGARILDVREPEEFAAGHIDGALSLPQAELADRLDELKKDEDLLVVCAGGVRSARAGQYLLANGYRGVRSLSGGMSAWLKAGLPVIGSAASAMSTEPDRYFHGSH